MREVFSLRKRVTGVALIAVTTFLEFHPLSSQQEEIKPGSAGCRLKFQRVLQVKRMRMSSRQAKSLSH